VRVKRLLVALILFGATILPPSVLRSAQTITTAPIGLDPSPPPSVLRSAKTIIMPPIGPPYIPQSVLQSAKPVVVKTTW